MKYSPEVQEQLDRLVKWAYPLGIHLIISNQGYSVRVFNLANPRGSSGMKLTSLVSLHNNGPCPYLLQELGITKAQAEACKKRTPTHVKGAALVPVTLQRIGAHLKSADIISLEEEAHLQAQVAERREYLDGQ